jgi:hypothetical protein
MKCLGRCKEAAPSRRDGQLSVLVRAEPHPIGHCSSFDRPRRRRPPDFDCCGSAQFGSGGASPYRSGGAKGVSQQFLTNRNRRTGRSREAFQIVVRPRFSSSNRYRDRHILIVATSSNRLRRSFALRFVSPLELGIRKQGSMPADGTFRRIGLLFFITLTLHHSMNEQVPEIASFPALLVAFLHRSTILIDDNHCSQTFRGKPGGRSGGANRSAANWSHQCLITGVSKRACVTPLPTG